MVVAESEMVDSVSETARTPDPAKRPSGEVLTEGAAVRAGDLVHVGDDVWRAVPQEAIGFPVAPGFGGCFVRPVPSPGTATQPAPTQAPEGATPVVDLVIADLRARAEAGLRTYGTRLYAHNGRRPDVDALQEVLDLAMYQRQLVAEIDDVRVVLGASESETLLAAAERAVARQNRYSDELGEVMDALGRHDDESTVDAAKRRMGERATLHDERDEARRRLTSTEADLAAARARITYLEQHLAGAQRDAREQREYATHLQAEYDEIDKITEDQNTDDGVVARVRNIVITREYSGRECRTLRTDLDIEREAHGATRRGWLTEKERAETLRAEHEETLRRLASAERELERHRHGNTIEGDYVCPDSLALTEARRQLDAVSDVAGFHEREIADLRAKLAEAERERDERAKERDAASAQASRLTAAIAGAPSPLDQPGGLGACPDCAKPSIHPVCYECLAARLAEAEERARRAEAERIEAVNDLATALGPDGVARIREAIAAREAQAPSVNLDALRHLSRLEAADDHRRLRDEMGADLDAARAEIAALCRKLEEAQDALSVLRPKLIAARADFEALTARVGEAEAARRKAVDVVARLHEARDAWFSAGKRALAEAQARVEMARAERDTAIALPCLRCGDGAEPTPSPEASNAPGSSESSPEPVAIETPDVVEAHHGRYRIRRPDAA